MNIFGFKKILKEVCRVWSWICVTYHTMLAQILIVVCHISRKTCKELSAPYFFSIRIEKEAEKQNTKTVWIALPANSFLFKFKYRNSCKKFLSIVLVSLVLKALFRPNYQSRILRKVFKKLKSFSIRQKQKFWKLTLSGSYKWTEIILMLIFVEILLPAMFLKSNIKIHYTWNWPNFKYS